ncbi:MAG: hypothetical protein EXQ92_10505 [Alphaproteobacteria bacterium]|nr:hypothetical protein [Alphaproteobacteria bacterium]
MVGTSYSAFAGTDRDKVSYIGPLKTELARRFPDSAIELVDKSSPRQTAVQMVERMERDVAPEKPQLVIWQTGTTDAVRATSTPPTSCARSSRGTRFCASPGPKSS